MAEDESSFLNNIKEQLTTWGDSVIDKYIDIIDIDEKDRPTIDPLLIPIIIIIIGIVILAMLFKKDDKSDTDKKLDRLLRLRIEEMTDPYAGM